MTDILACQRKLNISNLKGFHSNVRPISSTLNCIHSSINEMQQMKAQAVEKMNLKKSMMSWVEYLSPSFLAAFFLINSLAAGLHQKAALFIIKSTFMSRLHRCSGSKAVDM